MFGYCRNIQVRRIKFPKIMFLMIIFMIICIAATLHVVSPVLAQDAPFSAEGQVFDNYGRPVANVTVNFSGFEPAQTDANGFYSKSGLSGNVIIQPQKDGWEFNSTSLWGLPGQHYTNINFEGYTTAGSTPVQNPQQPPLTYAISGRVTTQTGQGVPDVTLYILEGHVNVTDNPETVTGKYPPTRTDENGNWSYAGLSGSVTVIPRKLGWNFVSPYVLAGNNSSVMNFVATEVTPAPESVPPAADDSVIKVLLDGKTLEFEQPPEITDGRTLVPFRAIFEALGAEIKYIAKTKTVVANRTITTITLKIGSATAYVDDKTVTLDVPARVVNGYTMVPLRFIGEAMGTDVSWNGTTRTITINSAKNTDFTEQTEFGPEDVLYREYKWSFEGRSWSWTFGTAKIQYEYFKNLKRLDGHDFSLYASSPYDDSFISGFIEKVKETKAQYSFSDCQTVDFLVAFVQSLPYVPDNVSTGYDEYPKYPIETLVENGGDCEDTSILMVTLLRELGYGAVLLELPGHMAVGVKGSDNLPGIYYTNDGVKYFYLETTGNGWTIGEVPPNHKDQSAKIFFIEPKPLLNHTWVTYTNDGPKIRVTVKNDGTGPANNCQVFVAFDAGNDMVYYPLTYEYFDLPPQESYICVFKLEYPHNVRTRFIVRVISDGYLMDESFSEWFDA